MRVSAGIISHVITVLSMYLSSRYVCLVPQSLTSSGVPACPTSCYCNKWDRKLNTVVNQRLYGNYLDVTFPCPDPALHPKAAMIWNMNNRALRAFMFEHISDNDYGIASVHPNAHDTYEAIRANHQNLGMLAQVNVLKEAIEICFTPGVPLTRTIDNIVKLHTKFFKMGALDPDHLLTILILNLLGRHYSRLQTSINDLLQNPTTTSHDVRNRLLIEEQTITSGDKQGDNTALAAVTTKPARPICANCKCPTHRTEFCISPGGQMAGKTIDEARAAQEAARKAGGTSKARNNLGSTMQSQSTSGDTNTQPNTSSGGSSKSITLNGKCYMLVDTNASTSDATETAMSAISIPMPAYDEEEYIAVLATTEHPFASVHWSTHSRPQPATPIPLLAYSAGRSSMRADDLPFILDTGATCHISPEASNFKNIRSIPCHPVKGLCGSAVYATGIGDIELHIAGSHTLKLIDTLYIPESTVCLISVLTLNKSGNYTTHFDSDGCTSDVQPYRYTSGISVWDICPIWHSNLMVPLP
jgi:hypothetical protein